MKRRIATITFLLILISVGVARAWDEGFYFYKIASAASQILEIEFQGDELHGPIFSVTNMLPGDCETREITIKNTSSKPREVFVKSEHIQDPNNLSSQINWEIKRGTSIIFSSTLKNFYSLSSSLNLGSFNNNQKEHIFFKGCMSTTTGNEYQNTKTEFDLIFSNKEGHSTALPSQCSSLKNKIKKFIIGTPKSESLFGSSQSEYINGAAGNDKIWGLSADDCILGENGNDKLYGGSGNDYLDGGANSDNINGGSGVDKCTNAETKISCEQ